MKRVLALALAAFAILPGVSLSADELTDWFRLSQAKAYLSLRPDLEGLRDRLAEADVPTELLVERVKEGAAKKVSPERLLAALREDSDRFLFLSSSYSRLPRDAAATENRLRFIRDGAIAMRSGIEGGIFDACLAGLASGGLQRRLAALLAVAAVNARFPLGGEDIPPLVLALDASSERDSRFSRLSSVFVRARGLGLDTRWTSSRAIAILSAGGNLFTLESDIDGGSR